jgi:LacI family transcriptional regulator
MVTIKDVSNYCGVSIATISRVVNSPEVVAPKTRTRVEEAIAKLGFYPNRAARGLTGARSGLVGIVINNFGTEYYAKLMEGVDAALDEVGIKGIAITSAMTASGEISGVHTLTSLGCDSVILHSDQLTDEQLDLMMVDYPHMVIMGRKVAGFPQRCVYMDDEKAARAVAAFLFDRGHRRVAQIIGHERMHVTVNRRRGFSSYFAEAGFPIADSLIVSADFSEIEGRGTMEQVLRSDPGVTAVFCHNDDMAWGAMAHCKAAGIRIPQDISIVGFDDLPKSALITPPLTSLAQPLHRIGYSTGQLALIAKMRRVAGDDFGHELPFQIMDRGSAATRG